MHSTEALSRRNGCCPLRASGHVPFSRKHKLVIAQYPARFIYTQHHLESPAFNEFRNFFGLGELIWPSPKPIYPIPHYRHSSVFLVFPISRQRILVVQQITDQAPGHVQRYEHSRKCNSVKLSLVVQTFELVPLAGLSAPLIVDCDKKRGSLGDQP